MFSLIYGLLAFLLSHCSFSGDLWPVAGMWTGRRGRWVWITLKASRKKGLLVLSNIDYKISAPLHLWLKNKKHSRWYFNNISHRVVFNWSAVRVTTVFQFRKTILLIRLNANVVTISARKYSKRFIFALLLSLQQQRTGCRLISVSRLLTRKFIA